jgi:hypothetical protein
MAASIFTTRPGGERKFGGLAWQRATGCNSQSPIAADRSQPSARNRSTRTMKTSEKKKLILLNLAVWIIAILAHPLSQLVPTSTGEPPKFYQVLIPTLLVILALISTYLFSAAIGKTEDS